MAFPPNGSEVVSLSAGVQLPCTNVAASLGILLSARVFVAAFYGENLAQKQKKVNACGGEIPKNFRKTRCCTWKNDK
jgi:hypothetical protein